MNTECLMRNLEAVRTGAMTCDSDAAGVLTMRGLVRRNSPDWYDLTDKGSAVLDSLQRQAAA